MNAETYRQKVERFFRTDYKKLINYVRKNIEDRFFGSSPEDIIQDVALSLLSRFDVDQQIENLAGYIYRSVKNRTTDIKRQKQIAESTDNPDIGHSFIDNLALIPDEVENDLFSELGVSIEELNEGFSKLKPDEQAIIMLTEFENRSFAELSEDWDVPIGTLLSRKHRALAKLHKLLINKENNKTVKINNNGNKRQMLSKQSMAL